MSVEANTYLSSAGGWVALGVAKALHVDDVGGVVNANGQVWLRSGVIETDISAYPDAKVVELLPGVNGFNAASQERGCVGVTWDGNHFWVVGQIGYRLFKYTSAGVYTGVSLSLGNHDFGTPLFGINGLHWASGSFWATVYTNDKIHQIDTSGNLTGFSIDVSAQMTRPNGITDDGTYLYVVDRDSSKVCQYTFAGVYTGFNFSTAVQGSVTQGIAWDGNHFWITDGSAKTLQKYSPEGTPLGSEIKTLSNGKSITWDGTKLWVLNGNVIDDLLVKAHVGLAKESFKANTNIPMYVSISDGGQVSVIGEVIGLNVSDINGKFTSNGQIWLKTGFIETDVASYPDAKQTTDDLGTYVGISTHITDQDTGFSMYVRSK